MDKLERTLAVILAARADLVRHDSHDASEAVITISALEEAVSASRLLFFGRQIGGRLMQAAGCLLGVLAVVSAEAIRSLDTLDKAISTEARPRWRETTRGWRSVAGPVRVGRTERRSRPSRLVFETDYAPSRV